MQLTTTTIIEILDGGFAAIDECATLQGVLSLAYYFAALVIYTAGKAELINLQCYYQVRKHG